MTKYPDVTRGQEEAIYNKIGGKEAIRRILADEVTVVLQERKPQPQPSAKAKAKEIPKTAVLGVGRFDVKKHVVANSGQAAAKVEISFVSPDFQAWFYGLEEDASEPEMEMKTIRGIYKQTELQPGGEKGYLLTNAINIFTVPDKTGINRQVYVSWLVDGWSWSASL
jgi:hypothetical protein